MPSTRVITVAALGCLFVSGLFNGQGIAQTASTDPVNKLIHFLHSGEPEAKPPGRSGAKHSSKVHPGARKPASTNPASKESASNEAPQVTASVPVIDSETMPTDANDIDKAAKPRGKLESDALS